AAVVSSAAASTAAAPASSRAVMPGDYRRARRTDLPALAPARYRRELPVVDLVVAVGVSRRDPGTDELPGASIVALTAPGTACCVIRHAGSRRSNTVSASKSPPSGVRWMPSAPRTRATLPPGTGSVDA